MELNLKIGDIYRRDEKDHRIVRIVENDTALFETPTKTYLVKTSYVMLMDEFKQITFHILFEQEIEQSPIPSNEMIRGLTPDVWRRK